jgi:hypothetical protein
MMELPVDERTKNGDGKGEEVARGKEIAWSRAREGDHVLVREGEKSFARVRRRCSAAMATTMPS